MIQDLKHSFALMVSTCSLDLRSVTSILLELKTLSASTLIAGIDSIVKAKLAKQGHSSALLIHQLKTFVGFCLRVFWAK